MNSQFEHEIQQEREMEFAKLRKDMCERNNATASQLVTKKLVHQEASQTLAQAKIQGEEQVRYAQQGATEGCEYAKTIAHNEVEKIEAQMANLRANSSVDAKALRERHAALDQEAREISHQLQVTEGSIARCGVWLKSPHGREFDLALQQIQHECVQTQEAHKRHLAAAEAAKAALNAEEARMKQVADEILLLEGKKRMAQDSVFVQQNRLQAGVAEARVKAQRQIDETSRATHEAHVAYSSLEGSHAFALREMVAMAQSRLTASLDAKVRSQRMVDQSVSSSRGQSISPDPALIVSAALDAFQKQAHELLTEKLNEFHSLLPV